MKRKQMNANIQAFKRAGVIQRNKVTLAAAKKAVQQSAELKGVDFSLASATISSALNSSTNMSAVNVIAVGSDYFNRIGRKIKMKSLRVYGDLRCTLFTAATTSTIEGISVRMVVVLDKQPSGTVPQFDEIFATTVAAGTEAAQLYSPLRMEETERFRVLRDKVMIYNPQLLNATGGSENQQEGLIHFDEFIKLGIEASYSATTAVVGSINHNAIYVCFKANINSAGVALAGVENSFARLRYTDL